MRFEKILTSKIDNDDLDKLNVMSLRLSPIERSSKRIIYEKKKASVSFYNSDDIRTCTFFKNTSLLIGKKAYELF